LNDDCDGVLKFIEEMKNSKIHKLDDYMKLFKKIMNNKYVHLDPKDLEGFSNGDAKTYAQIRIIGNLDAIIVNTNYRDDDYLRLRKQEIENKSKEELIEFIKQIN
jgi:hypothetical protein